MDAVDLPDIDLMSRLDAEFRATSGLTDRRFYKIFYSAIAPAPLLVLGFNPGGEVDGTDLNASSSFYENWEHDYVDFRRHGKQYSLAGPAYDTLVQVLQTTSEDAIRRVPATNVIFRRSRHAAALNLTARAAAHESAPVLAQILRAVDPAAILLLGSTAFRAFVGEHCESGSLVVNAEPPEILGANGRHDACLFRSAHAQVPALGRDVPLLMVGHPSTYARREVWREVVASLRAELLRLGVSPWPGTVVGSALSSMAHAGDRRTPSREPAPPSRPEVPAAVRRLPPADALTTPSQRRQSQVEPLRAVLSLLGLALEDPDAAYPGRGKVIRLAGGRRVYINAGHADVKAPAHEIAAWDAEGLGNTRPDSALYLRIMLDSEGTPRRPS
ncbi:hypothetical protein Celgi_2681 [Cellulomonas gilvus ATCC 13127]|uniref:Uracil-DNA glycosylase-like domain-containing protein n=1 Tax=Cellulomonas gilvus (strain ATCC 13127 / NRRL B-14078) TaxID=593907 RepID=F8A3Y8_CELGA|nr:hypothetical protein Celgi_2681 [Cellulomonas gilvus ATCC 13127]